VRWIPLAKREPNLRNGTTFKGKFSSMPLNLSFISKDEVSDSGFKKRGWSLMLAYFNAKACKNYDKSQLHNQYMLHIEEKV